MVASSGKVSSYVTFRCVMGKVSQGCSSSDMGQSAMLVTQRRGDGIEHVMVTVYADGRDRVVDVWVLEILIRKIRRECMGGILFYIVGVY